MASTLRVLVDLATHYHEGRGLIFYSNLPKKYSDVAQGGKGPGTSILTLIPMKQKL